MMTATPHRKALTMTTTDLTQALSDHTGYCPVCRLARQSNRPEMLCEVGTAILAMIRDRQQA
jgi:hypothetical protein